MNPNEPKPSDDGLTDAPDSNNSGTEPVQPSVSVMNTEASVPHESNEPTFSDTLSADQPTDTSPSPTLAASPEPTLSQELNTSSPEAEVAASSSASGEDPGRTMGIIGLVLAFLMPLAGLVVSTVARSKSKKAGHKNGLALAGILISVALILATIVGVVLFAMGATKVTQFCTENGPGIHTTENGVTITCKQ
jgi:hypothetical protein